MKSTSINILSDLESSLELHRLDENNQKHLKSHHWDYWFLPEEYEFNDIEIEKKFTKLNKEILSNTSYIKNLPKNYTTSGIIDLEDNWIDLQDFGWKMIDEPSNENRSSLKNGT